MNEDPPEPRGSMRARAHLVSASAVGNTLEWYDFAIFGFLTPYISQAFFPESDPAAGLLKTFGIFAAGYLMRPLGAVVFGHVGDRIGRRQALLCSVFLMAVPTFLLGLLPGHDRIGILAPMLLVVLRLLQGISVGGEFAASITFVSELSSNRHRGLVGSLTMCGAMAGFIIGSGACELVTALLGNDAMASWGWRVPFLSGILLALSAIWMRRSLPASSTFQEDRMMHDASPHPVVDVLTNQRGRLVRLVGIVLMQAVSFYMIFVWLPVSLNTLLEARIPQPLLLNTIGLVVLMGSIVGAGWLSDRIGRKPLLVGAALVLAGVSWPLFGLLQGGGFGQVLVVVVAFAVLIGAAQGPTPAMMAELFPTRSRLTGIGIGYNVTQAVAGGTAPAFCIWLIMMTHTNTAPAVYMTAAAVAGLVAAACLQDRTGRSLADGGGGVTEPAIEERRIER